MKKFFKVFQKEKDIIAIEYTAEDQKSYFKFVESQDGKGLRQVIITSEIMLKIIDYFFLKGFFVKNIEFDEEDLELMNDIKNVLMKIREDRAYFIKLFEKLKCISNSSSINLQKIEMGGKFETKYASFLIQVNGILKIEGEAKLLDDICKIIEEKLNEF